MLLPNFGQQFTIFTPVPCCQPDQADLPTYSPRGSQLDLNPQPPHWRLSVKVHVHVYTVYRCYWASNIENPSRETLLGERLLLRYSPVNSMKRNDNFALYTLNGHNRILAFIDWHKPIYLWQITVHTRPWKYNMYSQLYRLIRPIFWQEMKWIYMNIRVYFKYLTISLKTYVKKKIHKDIGVNTSQIWLSCENYISIHKKKKPNKKNPWALCSSHI